ncbi:MAG TPA: LysR substrate-binding domain-containing protein [Burkholderiales bacterium]|nr:LysR substrate-binding domain-containing protein [Burkholderiales bacterium]
MDLPALQIFKAVADAGGVTRAAARLHRVPSNVTTRLRQLEEKLGTPLFHRRKRRLILSEEGKTLLAYAERLLALSREAEAAIRNGAPRGTLALGALESTAAVRLPALLARFHAAHPEVRLELATGTTGALVDKVLSGELAAAFVSEPFTAEGLERRHVFTEDLVLITPRARASLQHVPILAFAAGCSYRRTLEAWLQERAIAPERVMEYGSYAAIVACVAAGGGIALVPRSVLGTMKAGKAVGARAVAKSKTILIWRERSSALDAFLSALSPAAAPARREPATPAYRSASRQRRAARPSPRSSGRASSR